MENNVKNRWIILFASIICNLIIGSAYAWSVFQKPLVQQFGWKASDAAWTFAITIAMMPIAMTYVGKKVEQWGPRKTLFIGGICFGLGEFLSGFASSLLPLYLAHGVLGGFGVGTVYGIAMSNTVRWFPDKKGLASGLIAAGLGSGAIFFAPIGNSLIQAYGIQSAFKILGVIYLVAIIISTLLIDVPPAGYRPAGWTPPPAALGVSGVDKDWREMLKDPIFYVLAVMFVMGAVSGLMIIGHASPIGQEVIGLSPATAALVVSILGLSNTLGRLFWGFMSDIIGRYNALICIYGFFAVAMYFMPTASTMMPFLIMVCAVGLGYGGLLGIYPTINADMFGLKNLGQNYGIMFFAFAVAAIIGPRLAAVVKESSGGYDQAFLIAAGMGLVGAVLTLYVKYELNKRRAKPTIAA